MKSSRLATTMVLLCASVCSPALAAPPTHIAKLAVPPAPISTSATKSSKPSPAVLHLPTQAGKVSKIIATSLVAKSPSWIANGDKYYSLCVPNRRMVSCAPIVPVGVMKDIEVGARAGAKGEPILSFKIAPGTKVAPKRLQYVIGHFLARTKKQVAHFNRMSVSYAPRPVESSLRIGANSSLVDASDGGGGSSITCSYDDEGSYDCTGGSYGSGGGGSGSDPIPGSVSTPDEPAVQCQINCDYPSGNNNGEADPCIDAAGNRICQVVEVPGQRPPAEETESVGCRPINPWTLECGRTPPVIGGVAQELPRGRTPWFPQAMCNTSSIFCSAGQEQDNDRGADSSLSGKTLEELYTLCNSIYEVEIDVCSANKGGGTYRQCSAKAANRLAACMSTARRVTGNGAYKAQ